MSNYVTATRDHDAEFLLGIQMKENDRQLQAARNGRKMVTPRSPVRDVGPVAVPTAAESKAAARFVCRMVERDAVDEVLAMLGLEAS